MIAITSVADERGSKRLHAAFVKASVAMGAEDFGEAGVFRVSHA